jgi:hypothetical protein
MVDPSSLERIYSSPAIPSVIVTVTFVSGVV